jgi:hypothetical protein
MGSDPVHIEEFAMVLKAHGLVKMKGSLASIAPKKIGASLAQVIHSVLKQYATKALASILLVGGHAAQTMRIARVKIRMWFCQQRANADELSFVKKTQVQGGRQIIAGIDAIFWMQKRLQYFMTKFERELGGNL